MKPKLSIIIPMYNMEAYLTECLASITFQLSESVEAILVNDGSVDGSEQICETFTAANPYFKYIKKTNGGLSSARNAGLAASEGKYVWFVDSDDFIRCDAIEKILSFIDNSSDDIIRFGFNLFDDMTGNSLDTYRNNPTKRSSFYSYFSENELLIQAWAGVYKKEFLKKNNIDFYQGLIFEDVFFNLLCFSKIGTISVYTDVLYHYRARNGSLLRSPLTENKMKSVVAIIQLCTNLIATMPKKNCKLHVRKKFDYIYLYAQQLKKYDKIDHYEKIKLFKGINRHVPLLQSDKLGLKLHKILLRLFPKYFYKLVIA